MPGLEPQPLNFQPFVLSFLAVEYYAEGLPTHLEKKTKQKTGVGNGIILINTKEA